MCEAYHVPGAWTTNFRNPAHSNSDSDYATLCKPKVILSDHSYVLGVYAGGGSLKGKPVIVRNTRGIVPDFVRALNEATEMKMAWVSGWMSTEDTKPMLKGSQGVIPFPKKEFYLLGFVWWSWQSAGICVVNFFFEIENFHHMKKTFSWGYILHTLGTLWWKPWMSQHHSVWPDFNIWQEGTLWVWHSIRHPLLVFGPGEIRTHHLLPYTLLIPDCIWLEQ
jgi:hypothetical protein